MANSQSNFAQEVELDRGLVNITVKNFSLVQVGRSSRLSTEVEQDSKEIQGLGTSEAMGEDQVINDPGDVTTMPNLHKCGVTKSTSAETQDPLDVEYRMPLIRKYGFLTGKQCEIVMKTLEELQDNGQFQAHEDLACKLLDFYKKAKNPDMEASLMIERGVAFYYANDLIKSQKLFKAAIGMGESLQNRNLLQGRAYVLLGTAYRYETKFGKAFQYLKQGAELLSNHEPGEDTADLCYYYGVKWLYFYWCSFADGKGRQIFKKRAKEYLESSIANCARDERPRVQLKKKRYFSLRLAALHLDCGTRAARQTRRVRNGDIEEAKKHLDVVEYQLNDEIPLGTEIQLLKTRSDQYRREGNFGMAKETAQQALSLAKRINMRLEIVPLNERIEESANLLAASSPDVNTERFNDSGCSADSSSSN